MSTALVFGANGISGLALISHLVTLPTTRWKKIIALSRSPPVFEHNDDRVVFRSVDLLGDSKDLVRVLREAGAANADHVFFYAYVAKEDERELIETNKVLFENAVNAVGNVSTSLESFQLQTGYKYYGTHKGGKYLAPYPWEESAPRHPGENFYYVEENLLDSAASKHGWRQIVTRPNFIIGASKGNFMSLATTLGLYAMACKATGQKLVYPGSSVSWDLPYDMSIAEHNAAFQCYAAEKGLEGAYNIHAGKPITFGELWPRLAKWVIRRRRGCAYIRYFDVPVNQPLPNTQPISDPPEEVITPHPIAQWAAENEQNFQQIAKDLNLEPDVFKYATWDFADFAAGRTWKDEGSLKRATAAGWKEEVDVWEGFERVFAKLREWGVLPQ